MMTSLSSILQLCIVVVAHATIVLLPTSAQLSAGFYNKLCPQALPAIRRVVRLAVFREPRMGASLLRMHFHDCFVNGCDGSILLDDTSTFRGEKTAFPNVNSVRGFEVIDDIKNAVDNACHGNVVSCADILAVAARDSIYYLDGPFYPVLLGRRDARNASWDDANASLPPPFFNFTQLLSNFHAQGLNLKDLVVLSGAHTIGLAHCFLFRDRIYNDSNIDPNFAASVRQNCPSSGGDFNTQPLDATTRRFDTVYFRSLLRQRGLLHSDQELYKNNGGESNKLVEKYSLDPLAFARDFSDSMINMGNIKPLTGNNGEVRSNCRKIN